MPTFSLIAAPPPPCRALLPAPNMVGAFCCSKHAHNVYILRERRCHLNTKETSGTELVSRMKQMAVKAVNVSKTI
jgi:hypothetical protein